MIIEYYDTYEYSKQLLLLMDSDSKLQFLAAATFLGVHSLIVTLYIQSASKRYIRSQDYAMKRPILT